MSRWRQSVRRLAGMALLLGAGLLVVPMPAIGAPAPGRNQHGMVTQAPAATVPPPSQATTTIPSPRGVTTTSTAASVPLQPQPPMAPGLFDVPGRIRKAIDDWFQGLVASAVNPALDLLGRTLLATPRLATGGRARELWLVSLGLADGAYVLLVTIGGVVLLAHESLQVQYSVKEIAPRLVVGAVAANLSFVLARQGIELANAASAALLGQQVDPANVTATIRTLALAPLQPGSLFTTLLVGAMVVLAVVLAGTCVVRVMLVVFLVVAAPLMLAAHALPQTEELARLWWRAMAGCLGVQVAQALVLVMAVRVFLEADRPDVVPLGGGHLVDVMVACCLLWLLIRIPAWAARSVIDGGRRGTLVRLVKSVVVVRTVRALHYAIGGS